MNDGDKGASAGEEMMTPQATRLDLISHPSDNTSSPPSLSSSSSVDTTAILITPHALLKPDPSLALEQGTFASVVSFRSTFPTSWPGQSLSDICNMISEAPALGTAEEGLINAAIAVLMKRFIGSKDERYAVTATSNMDLHGWRAAGQRGMVGEEGGGVRWSETEVQRNIRRARYRHGSLVPRLISQTPGQSSDSATSTPSVSALTTATSHLEQSVHNGVTKPDYVYFGVCHAPSTSSVPPQTCSPLASPADVTAPPVHVVSIVGERKDNPYYVPEGLSQSIVYLKTAFEAFGTYMSFYMFRGSYVRMFMLEKDVLVVESDAAFRRAVSDHLGLSGCPRRDTRGTSDDDEDTHDGNENENNLYLIPILTISLSSFLTLPRLILLNMFPHCIHLSDRTPSQQGAQPLWDLLAHAVTVVLAHETDCPRIDVPTEWTRLVSSWTAGVGLEVEVGNDQDEAFAASLYPKVRRGIKRKAAGGGGEGDEDGGGGGGGDEDGGDGGGGDEDGGDGGGGGGGGGGDQDGGGGDGEDTQRQGTSRKEQEEKVQGPKFNGGNQDSQEVKEENPKDMNDGDGENGFVRSPPGGVDDDEGVGIDVNKQSIAPDTHRGKYPSDDNSIMHEQKDNDDEDHSNMHSEQGDDHKQDGTNDEDSDNDQGPDSGGWGLGVTRQYRPKPVDGSLTNVPRLPSSPGDQRFSLHLAPSAEHQFLIDSLTSSPSPAPRVILVDVWQYQLLLQVADKEIWSKKHNHRPVDDASSFGGHLSPSHPIQIKPFLSHQDTTSPLLLKHLNRRPSMDPISENFCQRRHVDRGRDRDGN
ncbi:hypothetical protein M231_04067 [Tremella mesenterica]|uniref:Uncharacterized protein n=1 Tax=Tremella mesenterica TaxID=5217 RepID=A0A4Q1BLU6_TREME|nr:hypothetical protein M231_04067 [Tremella mesenterica]